MKILEMSAVVFGLVIFFFGCSLKEATTVEAVPLPDHQIVEEDIDDTPLKTQIEQHILVSGEINEGNLKALLKQQFGLVMNRRGFQYHDVPTSVYLYVYETKEQAKAGQGLWLAMLQMSPRDNSKPEITTRKELISQIGKKLEEKHGLSGAKRKVIYKELLAEGLRATEEAMKREPSNINKQIDIERELRKKYKEKLAKKYNLSKDQLKAIGLEGAINRWPF